MTEVLKLSEIFEHKNEKVGDLDIRPMSCTNEGIFPRDEKFSKNLSKSLSKNKIANKGDFVFGMSRKILNYGMMIYDEGCFSGAYKVYKCKLGYKFSVFLDLYIKNNHDYFYQCIVGGAREGQSISEDILFDLEVKMPSKEQLDILFDFYQLINEQIEIKQKIRLNLEVIAKTLFKSWFIDFDPVKAKSEGKLTGLSKEVSDLFPDSFEDSVLGEIPINWSVSNIDEIAEKVLDKYKKEEDWSNEKLIDLSRMPSNSIALTSYGKGKELSTSVCRFKKYDFLFGSIRPYFYKAGICPFNGVSNTSVFILRTKKDFDREFMYFYSASESTFKKSVQYSEGTKMPVIKWNYFKEFSFALPDEELRKHFSTKVRPIVEKIILNIEEQESLLKFRDLLLPKLISGKLSISDAKSFIEKANI